VAIKVALEWRVDQSLRRLRTDYIDIYQVHWPDPTFQPPRSIARKVRAGNVRRRHCRRQKVTGFGFCLRGD